MQEKCRNTAKSCIFYCRQAGRKGSVCHARRNRTCCVARKSDYDTGLNHILTSLLLILSRFCKLLKISVHFILSVFCRFYVRFGAPYFDFLFKLIFIFYFILSHFYPFLFIVTEEIDNRYGIWFQFKKILSIAE